MEQLWAPWRIEYIVMPKPSECVLCEKPKENDDESNYLLYRGSHNYVILNCWPYNPGHLMVAPYRHISSLEELSDEELREHWDILRRCVTVLKRVYQPGGYNLGINIGKVAGAGIVGHIHTHVVPRWEGDSNFMPVISSTRIIPEALASSYQKLKGEV